MLLHSGVLTYTLTSGITKRPNRVLLFQGKGVRDLWLMLRVVLTFRGIFALNKDTSCSVAGRIDFSHNQRINSSTFSTETVGEMLTWPCFHVNNLFFRRKGWRRFVFTFINGESCLFVLLQKSCSRTSWSSGSIIVYLHTIAVFCVSVSTSGRKMVGVVRSYGRAGLEACVRLTCVSRVSVSWWWIVMTRIVPFLMFSLFFFYVCILSDCVESI